MENESAEDILRTDFMSSPQKRIFVNICNKCKKEMPFDDKKSNENWKVYKNECNCGCKEHTMKFLT